MDARRDVIELLTDDHRTIQELARQLDETDQPALARELFTRLVSELAAHEAAEQRVVFPVFRAALAPVEPEADARLDEHEEINELLAEMQTLTPTGMAFAKRASALRLDLERHFDAEERWLFPRMRATLRTHQLVEMAEAAGRAKEAAPVFPEAIVRR